MRAAPLQSYRCQAVRMRWTSRLEQVVELSRINAQTHRLASDTVPELQDRSSWNKARQVGRGPRGDGQGGPNIVTGQ